MSASILVTGASGKLGKLVVEQLLAHGASPSSIAAMVRSKDKGEEFVAKGVEVRIANYEDVESLKSAVQGIKRALLISSNALGKRAEQHGNFIQVLQQSKTSVELIAYTSITRADTSPMVLAEEHKETELALTSSGIPYASLRNSWYIENSAEQLNVHVKTGSIVGASHEGRYSAASRRDYAEAAAIVLLSEKPTKSIYELGGHPGYTLDEFAALASKVTNKPIKAVHLSKIDYQNVLISHGLPAAFAEVIADAEDKAASGALEDQTHDLEALLGRPSESIEKVMYDIWKAISES